MDEPTPASTQRSQTGTELREAMVEANRDPSPDAILDLARALDAYSALPSPSWAFELSARHTLGLALLRHHGAPREPLEPIVRRLLGR
jgi:hypothetical protein